MNRGKGPRPAPRYDLLIRGGRVIDPATVADRIKEGGTLPRTEVLNIACQIADELDAAHERCWAEWSAIIARPSIPGL